jgi:hypothetical protein
MRQVRDLPRISALRRDFRAVDERARSQMFACAAAFGPLVSWSADVFTGTMRAARSAANDDSFSRHTAPLCPPTNFGTIEMGLRDCLISL